MPAGRVRSRPKPKPIRLMTDRFLLRSLRPEDAGEPYSTWLADPEVMTPLNQVARSLSRDELRGTILSRDGINDFLIGIFVRHPSKFIGLYFIDADWHNKTVTFSVLIGDKSYWGSNVVAETRAVLLDHFFDVLGAEKAIGQPPARNIPSVFNYKAEGWRLEGTFKGQLQSNLDDSRLDQFQFGLLKDEWFAMRKGKNSDSKS